MDDHLLNAKAIQLADELLRPFMLLKPRIYPDGNAWCALYGDNLQDGVAGFGDTPESAAVQFDINWLNQGLPSALQYHD